jgi:hypothetical protein
VSEPGIPGVTWLDAKQIARLAAAYRALTIYLRASIHAGAWSLAFSRPRTSRSTSALVRRFANGGLSSKWSMRRPVSPASTTRSPLRFQRSRYLSGPRKSQLALPFPHRLRQRLRIPRSRLPFLLQQLFGPPLQAMI